MNLLEMQQLYQNQLRQEIKETIEKSKAHRIKELRSIRKQVTKTVQDFALYNVVRDMITYKFPKVK